MIDPRIASLLSPKAKFNAGLRALGELSSQLVNRGAPTPVANPAADELGQGYGRLQLNHRKRYAARAGDASIQTLRRRVCA